MRHIGDEGGLDGGDTFEEEKSTIFGGGKERTKCWRGVEDTWEKGKKYFHEKLHHVKQRLCDCWGHKIHNPCYHKDTW